MELWFCPIYVLWMTLLIVICLMISLISSLLKNETYFVEFMIPPFKSNSFSLSFLIDQWSVNYSMCILLVTMSILLFSTFYMKGTINHRRFVFVLLLFVTSMLLLVFSGNMLTLFLGWDGLGISSFCLVIFYESKGSLSAGLLTIFSNRIGDILFLILISMLLSFGVNSVNQLIHNNQFLSYMMILSAVTKSAQFPFSAWLPAAMAAPTPVSSLVHSSTLVTAGLFFMVRMNMMMFEEKFLLQMMSIITMLIAGLFAIMEFDMKKMVAMSTLSQLGLMSLFISCNMWKMSMIHMMFHSLFKSLMFMSAGSLILFSMSNQDFRSIKKSSNIKISWVMMLSSSLSLSGFPFTLGFYSKDLLIMKFQQMYFLIMVLFIFGCLVTIMYSWRMILNLSSLCVNKKVIFCSFSQKVFSLSVMTNFILCSIFNKTIMNILQIPVLPSSKIETVLGILILMLSTFLIKNVDNMKKYDNLSKMLFLKYLSSDEISKSNNLLKNHIIEKSWMEMLGKVNVKSKVASALILGKVKGSVKISPLIFLGVLSLAL